MSNARRRKDAAIFKNPRTGLGLSVEQMAGKLKIGRQGLWRIETGRVSASFETIRRLCRLCSESLGIFD